MTRGKITIFFLVFVMIYPNNSATGAIKPGDACTKIGISTKINGVDFVCIKSGGKLVWKSGSNPNAYSAAFAKKILAEAKNKASEILSNATSTADRISTPPNCKLGNLRVSSSIGTDPNLGLRALIFENTNNCDLVVSATATFLCESGTQRAKNAVSSTGIFPLNAGQKIIVSSNITNYFPDVLTSCRLLTGFSSNNVNIDRDQQAPTVRILSSKINADFNQSNATKQSADLLAKAKAQAAKIIADAKNPVEILKIWQQEKSAEELKGAVCVQGGRCSIGNKGPGGGVVFYDAGSQQNWGRYLEVAPKEWFDGIVFAGEPEQRWLSFSAEFGSRGTEIGTGKSNSDLAIAALTKIQSLQEWMSLFILVPKYSGGGKSDWYLPSKDELNELCKYAWNQLPGESNGCLARGTLRLDFEKRFYWSSSEINEGNAWSLNFNSGEARTLGKEFSCYVRLIRAF